MRVELFERLIELQHSKIELSLDYIDKIANIMLKYSNVIPKDFKEDFIRNSNDFIDKYNKLIGEGGYYASKEDE